MSTPVINKTNSKFAGTARPTCPEGLFACNNGQCVRSDAKCNGVNDCADESDEADCKGIETSLLISRCHY